MIWYACYASNMYLQRFLIYLQGGQLEVNGLMKPYRRCDDDFEEPRQTEPYVIHRRFYFAKESGTLDNHGVGFISTKKDLRSLTYARLYLISEIQFKHLFASENGRKTTNIDFDIIKNSKSQDFDYNIYNRIIQLEDNYKGHPVITFTNKEVLAANNPMDRYLQLIRDGLEAVHQLNANEIVAYFKKSKVKMSKSSIRKIVTAKKSS